MMKVISSLQDAASDESCVPNYGGCVSNGDCCSGLFCVRGSCRRGFDNYRYKFHRSGTLALEKVKCLWNHAL